MACLGLWLTWSAVARADPSVEASVDPPDSAQPSESTEPREPAWCASELEVWQDEICSYIPENLPQDRPTTLVIYLHGVIQPGTTWQYGPQRGMVRAANKHGFAVIMPRGRRGIGPGSMRDWWTWPTSARAQTQVEQAILQQWAQARAWLEQRLGKPFEKVYVVGFSNGAYYAASLALRGVLSVNGYVIVAGGSAQAASQGGAQATHRPPIYIGYGHRDSVGQDCRSLGQALARLRWKHRIVGRPRVGHLMTDSQIEEAMEFFRTIP